MKLLKILCIALLMLAVGGGIVWRFYPVQLLVLADRLSHPVAAPQACELG